MKRIAITATVILTLALAAFAAQAIAQTAFKAAGKIESTTGGYVFPDGTIQATAALSSSRESVDMAGYQTNSANYGGSCSVPLYEVPEGMRLVVELVTGFASVTSGTADFSKVYLANGATVENDILTQTIAGVYYLEPKRIIGTTEDQITVSQQVRVYVQPNKLLQLSWSIPNYVVGATCWAHVTGYLEPVR